MSILQDKYKLIKKGLIPISKYWSIRLCFLDIINGTRFFLPLIEGREDIGDDLRVAIRVSREWLIKDEHNVGEAGALFRLLQFASWKLKLNKRFIKERTLKNRNICSNSDIINWPVVKLLELDNHTAQWASAAILMGNKEEIPDDFFLNLSKEALIYYNEIKEKGGLCELRYDETILSQAEAFMDLLKNGRTDFTPMQPDDYCFARAFNLINKQKGEERWPALRGHESNRLEAMEEQISNLDCDKIINSKDHRVIQSIAMLALLRKKRVKFSFPSCVSKSWPQFWDFLHIVS